MLNIEIRSTQKDVEEFLKLVREILIDESKFVLKKERFHEKSNPKFTTNTCMLELEYDNTDVMEHIITLESKHYYQTKFDDKGRGTSPLYVFIKEIQSKQVYIKLRIKENDNGEYVICISFHFAEHEVNDLPYK